MSAFPDGLPWLGDGLLQFADGALDTHGSSATIDRSAFDAFGLVPNARWSGEGAQILRVVRSARQAAQGRRRRT